MNISYFITVRTSSSRLPQKCLLPFGDMNIIEHIIRRAKIYNIDPILCTSTDSSDDILEEIANNEKIKFYRGSLINKLKRWYDCCDKFSIDVFHTIDADDPFFDGKLMQNSIDLLIEKRLDVVCPTESSSSGDASVGYSLTKNIIGKALDLIDDDDKDTEMMWHYLDNVRNINKAIMTNNNNPYEVRLTLDYEEDYWLLQTVRRIIGNFAEREKVDKLFKNNPDLFKINRFRNEEWKKSQELNRIDNKI